MVVVNNLLVSGRQVPRRSINSRINERPALSSSERAQRSPALSPAFVRRSFRYFYNSHGGPRDQQTGGSARNNARPPTCRRAGGGTRAREREREENTDETRARARRQTRREGGEGVTRKKSAREMKTDTTDRGLFSAGETNPLDTG